MGISIESVWSKAQRLSASDRLALSRRLRESVNETDSVRQARVTSEIDRFFGGWSDDPRTTDEIMQQIREGRTETHILSSNNDLFQVSLGILITTQLLALTIFLNFSVARNTAWRRVAISLKIST